MNNKKQRPHLYIGADHTGYDLKQKLITWLNDQGYIVSDLGGKSASDPDDYPDFGIAVGEKVSNDPKSFGITLCGTGVGICIAANKVPGIRAALVYDPKIADLTIRHDHANVLSLASWHTSFKKMQEIISIFLNAKQEGGRHTRRVNKIIKFERKEFTVHDNNK